MEAFSPEERKTKVDWMVTLWQLMLQVFFGQNPTSGVIALLLIFPSPCCLTA